MDSRIVPDAQIEEHLAEESGEAEDSDEETES